MIQLAVICISYAGLNSSKDIPTKYFHNLSLFIISWLAFTQEVWSIVKQIIKRS